MISERQLKLRLLAAAAALAWCCTLGYQQWLSSGIFPLWWVAAIVAAGELLRNLHMLSARPARSAARRAAEPAGAAAADCLQHAPIALFQVDIDTPDAPVRPLNTNADRIISGYAPEHRTELEDKLRQQAVGQRTLIWHEGERGAERALLAASAVTRDGRRQHLLAWMPVENELEAETLSAWRELTHVLTHEIMNSLTPVASLSRTAQALLESVHGVLPDDINEDLAIAFATIERRTTSLHQFVESYRTLSDMPAPRPEPLNLTQAFRRLEALLGPAWRARGGQASFSVESSTLEIEVDPGQFEQALLNLLANAADATAGHARPQVHVQAKRGRGGKMQIDIRDNGIGVPDDLAAQIFVPFFSTKERSSGIGLALVRQLLHRNGGTVRYIRPVHGGAQFSITFAACADADKKCH